MAKKPAASADVTIPAMEIGVLELTLIGDSGLITHNWSQEAKDAMLGKQMGKPTAGRAPKDPQKDYEACLYHLPNDEGYGHPSIGFKKAAVAAARQLPDYKMTELMGAFHVVGDLVKIDGTPEPHEAMVRLASGVASIQYRALFPTWKATLRVRYNKNFLTAAELINLFNVAGFSCGIGDWRPEKRGNFGMFHVAADGEE